MKRSLSVFSSIALLSVMAIQPFEVFAQEKVNKVQENVIDYKAADAPMPSFSIKTIEGTLLNNAEVASVARTVMVIFNPSCGHCIDLASAVAARGINPEKEAFVFIAAPGMGTHLEKFASETGLEKWFNKGLYLGEDVTEIPQATAAFSVFLNQVFEYSLPQVNVYDENKKMIAKQQSVIDWELLEEKLKP